jgi:hypothetical protein
MDLNHIGGVFYPHHIKNAGGGGVRRDLPSGFSLIRCLHPLPECAGWKRSQLILTNLQAPATCPQELSFNGTISRDCPIHSIPLFFFFRMFTQACQDRTHTAQPDEGNTHLNWWNLSKNEEIRGLLYCTCLILQGRWLFVVKIWAKPSCFWYRLVPQ